MLPFTFLTNLVSASTYIWPSPQLDARESLRFDLDQHALLGFIVPCDQYSLANANSARYNRADWIRTSFHDFGTYNISDGTGGLDASIRFAEEERPEDPGNGFANTLGIVFIEADHILWPTQLRLQQSRIFGSDGNVTMNSFAASFELFASTCETLLARTLDTVPAGVELTEVITLLPVKPSNIQLVLNGDVLQFSGQVRVNTDTVLLFLKDHANGTTNATLLPSNVDLNNGRTPTAWYSTAEPFLSLNAIAGLTTMRFSISGEITDQDDVGFAVQDRVVFSYSSCQFPTTTPAARSGYFDFTVRNDVKVTRLFFQEASTDDTGRPIIIETDIPQPSQPVAASAAVLWSLNSTQVFALELAFAVGITISVGCRRCRSDPIQKHLRIAGTLRQELDFGAWDIARIVFPVYGTSHDSFACFYCPLLSTVILLVAVHKIH
ncbi:hypothetical protein K438DRAFT_1769238 [Mycena galopus ATCC 62051]|nr:hypothetical protein K438DRAFT_1769238 [Mycena galopus ATCC 62051]